MEHERLQKEAQARIEEENRRKAERVEQERARQAKENTKLRNLLNQQTTKLDKNTVGQLLHSLSDMSDTDSPVAREAISAAQAAIGTYVSGIMETLQSATSNSAPGGVDKLRTSVQDVDAVIGFGYVFSKEERKEIDKSREIFATRAVSMYLTDLGPKTVGPLLAQINEVNQFQLYSEHLTSLIEEAHSKVDETVSRMISDVRAAAKDRDHTDHFFNMQKAMENVDTALSCGEDLLLSHAQSQVVAETRALMKLGKAEWHSRQKLYHDMSKSKLEQIISLEHSSSILYILQAALALLGYSREKISTWDAITEELRKTGRHGVKRALGDFSPTKAQSAGIVDAQTCLISVEDPLTVSLVSPVLYSFYTWCYELILLLDKKWAEENLQLEDRDSNNGGQAEGQVDEKKTKKRSRSRRRLKSAVKKATLF
eukprot:g6711.t1